MRGYIFSAFAFFAAATLLAGMLVTPVRAEPSACSAEWGEMVEKIVMTGDGQGHGPDICSDEWQRVVEFRLKLRDDPQLPQRGSEAWVRYIDARISAKAAGAEAGSDTPSGPSYDCGGVEPGSAEALICGDEGLSALDRKIAEVYAAAVGKAGEGLPHLRAEQRGWIKGRNECWKSEDETACIRDSYTDRIVELQARYRLVPGTEPVFYQCDGDPANEVVVTYFQTEPETLIAERGDSVSFMILQAEGEETLYRGRNENIRERQDEILVQWGFEADVMHCRERP